jgi:hypothetical protein
MYALKSIMAKFLLLLVRSALIDDVLLHFELN